MDAMGFCALGVELVLGLDHSLLLRLPQLVPGVLPDAKLATGLGWPLGFS